MASLVYAPNAELGGMQPHDEDAFLSAFAHFTDARGVLPSEVLFGIELARTALDFTEDVDGVWQALPIELWLDDACLRPRHVTETAVRRLARGFLDWLVDCGVVWRGRPG